MSIIVSGITLPFSATDGDAVREAVRRTGLGERSVLSSSIHKLSFDLRHNNLSRVYSVELRLDTDEAKLADGLGLPSVKVRAASAMASPTGTARLTHRPVIVGFGPAGLFAALVLARNGYAPLVLEKGAAMEQRDAAVDRFFGGGALDLSANVQFGEGGAGTYSDGKLTTRIGDPRCQLVLDLLREHGAEADMLRRAKPHIGTDKLKHIVTAMRREIVALGGEVRFLSGVSDVLIDGDKLKGFTCENGEAVPAEVAVLAAGHSARDLFALLKRKNVSMTAKPFSVGVRMEHLQADIDQGLYGRYAGTPGLPPGEYALSRREGERGCYTFCMCPGGYVVAAASERGGVVTNGMSYHARSGKNANAAVCVAVTPEDFGSGDVLAGVDYQRRIEQAAFAAAGGDYKAPAQLWGDFEKGRVSDRLGRVEPTYSRGIVFTDLTKVLPDVAADMIRRSMPHFGRKIRGFDAPDVVFTAPVTRTSSPVRILRGDDLMSLSLRGLIPCGEGAGYAGGIVSAAVDGVRAAEKIMELYAPLR